MRSPIVSRCLRALPRNIFRTLGLFAWRAGRWYARGLSLLDTGLRPLESAAQAEGGPIRLRGRRKGAPMIWFMDYAGAGIWTRRISQDWKSRTGRETGLFRPRGTRQRERSPR